MRPALYLIPVPLGEQAMHTLPACVISHLHALRHFVAERARTARRFLKATEPPFSLDELHIEELNEHTPAEAVTALLEPVRQGHPLGLLSEAGCPAVADPGALLVRQAHLEGIEVVPLPGPSSLLLALMASGFNGQQFSFHGYLPRKKAQLVRALRRLEQEVQRHGSTQLFIEAPYRNTSLFETMLQTLAPDTALCIACDLTLESEWIRTRTIGAWQAGPLPDLHKRPAVFLIGRMC